MHNAPVFSFVLPAYNEEMNLQPMAERLLRVGESLGRPFEIIWVDDGSTDGTGARLDAMAESEPRIRALHFSRNFGHMAALTAGLEAARATGAVITLDSDGQHPPELIADLVARWGAGVDIVQTIREQMEGASPAKRITSRGFYRVLNTLGELDLPEGAADFRLMDRQAVDALNQLPEHVRFVRGLVHWVGFTREYMPYQAPARMGGETKYNYFKMLKFAFSGITSFSVRPLHLSFLMAAGVIGAAFLYGVYVVGALLAGKAIAPGWTSLLLVMMVLGGAQLIAIGIASEYLAQLFIEQKRRPVYVVKKKRGEAS